MLTQHNQEFRRYIPDPLSLLGVGSGHETTVDRANCCAHERALTTENAKGYVRTRAEARRVLVSSAGSEIVEHMLRDPTAILCRSC